MSVELVIVICVCGLSRKFLPDLPPAGENEETQKVTRRLENPVVFSFPSYFPSQSPPRPGLPTIFAPICDPFLLFPPSSAARLPFLFTLPLFLFLRSNIFSFPTFASFSRDCQCHGRLSSLLFFIFLISFFSSYFLRPDLWSSPYSSFSISSTFPTFFYLLQLLPGYYRRNRSSSAVLRPFPFRSTCGFIT